MTQSSLDPHIRDHLANERTFLAYMRTSLALLSLGISINRFAQYLLEKNRSPVDVATRPPLIDADKLGIGMAVIGFTLLVYGIVRFTMMTRQIATRIYRPNLRAMWLLSAILLSSAMAGLYLLFAR